MWIFVNIFVRSKSVMKMIVIIMFYLIWGILKINKDGKWIMFVIGVIGLDNLKYVNNI